MLPLASPPEIPPEHALVVEATSAYDAPELDEPITTATLRDARGTTRTVRVVGGASRGGGVTRLAGIVLPVAGAVVRLDLAEEPAAPSRVRAWTRGDFSATWAISALPVHFALALPTSRDLGADASPELDVALRTWPLVACTAWRSAFDGTTTVPAGDDGINGVYWHDDAWPSALLAGALAQTVLHVDGAGALHDADVHVNGAAYRWSRDGAGSTIDARSVLVHELGHALGLGHSTVAGATMNATHPPGIAWRSLEQDDRDGVCALYPGRGADGCDAAPCPAGFACVARVCERIGARAEVCSPCARAIGACEGAGDDARCIDIGDGATAGRVCGRACASDADCGPRFRCLATTASGDLQCVASDACASGPWPCATDADCASAGAACRRGACVGPGDAPPQPDAGAPDAALAPPIATSGGCALAPGRAGAVSPARRGATDRAPLSALALAALAALAAFARARRARNTARPWTSACSSTRKTSTSPASRRCSTSSATRGASGQRASGAAPSKRASTRPPKASAS